MSKTVNYKKIIDGANLIKEEVVDRAKDMLVESIAPHIKTFIDNKIHEEDEDNSPDQEEDGDKVIPDEENDSTEEIKDDEVAENDDGDSDDEMPMTDNDEIPMNDESPEDEVSDDEIKEDEDVIPDTDEDENGDGGDEEISVDDDNDEDENVEENIDEADINELIEKINANENKKTNKKVVKENKNEVLDLRKKLYEAHKAINLLYRNLNETALLNTKLSYVFSILNERSMTRNEKVRIVKLIDEAKTAREAKFIYRGLKESYNGLDTNKTKNVKTKRIANITEGIQKHISDKKEVIKENKDQNKEKMSPRDQMITENLGSWLRLSGIEKKKDEK